MTIYPLAYPDDLITHYQSFCDMPGFVLLESTDQRRGRYDIMSACPYDQLKIARDANDINTAFREFERMLPAKKSFCDLPFQGGAIGYIAYDLGAKLAGIHSPPHPMFADLPILDIQFYDWAIVTDHLTRQVNLIVANHRPETASMIAEICNRWKKKSLTNQKFKLLDGFKPLITKQDYQQAFHAIHQDLKQGRAYQVNYTQPFMAGYDGDAWEMYKLISRKNPVPYSAFLRNSSADVLSFSPERFLQMEKGNLLTSPIKGSARRSSDGKEDGELQAALLASSKNRAENVMIVDLLRNDLGKIALPGSVKVKTLCELQSYNAIHHLVSDITAECATHITPVEAFAACFPGGSITGAPKLEAMRVISEHEPFARGVYCGSIGYFSVHGRFDSNVAIRTVTAKNNSLYLAAGGGIVIDSTWEDEYRECYTKIRAIVNEI